MFSWFQLENEPITQGGFSQSMNDELLDPLSIL